VSAREPARLTASKTADDRKDEWTEPPLPVYTAQVNGSGSWTRYENGGQESFQLAQSLQIESGKFNSGFWSCEDSTYISFSGENRKTILQHLDEGKRTKGMFCVPDKNRRGVAYVICLAHAAFASYNHAGSSRIPVHCQDCLDARVQYLPPRD